MKRTTVTIMLDDNKIILDIEGYYTPFVEGVRYDEDGSGVPDRPSGFEIDKIIWNKQLHSIDVTDFLNELVDDGFENLEQLCLNEIESD